MAIGHHETEYHFPAAGESLSILVALNGLRRAIAAGLQTMTAGTLSPPTKLNRIKAGFYEVAYL
ncbi:hypothetical protein AU490_11180 [Lonsdalea populi]|uniref:Uncharacterized protein n=1 Tax=Lonsdalea populi TaxID=1172565 RepID=A0A3N0UB35_9GAMM|nr:hypothetical protein AU499_11590 [Lonsdalea populi]RAT15837.1 hypothetical protein AU486_09255 [Lonsdalea quercina]RAT27878.1 hypothetical protein AU490_11180 [Lonsdalea populi]RAT38821.1 hypothetical protein AU491_02930 [Lonsdalea populi]RAT42513.1 hypothetical protein AU494_10890 [Lonsdalea populi]